MNLIEQLNEFGNAIQNLEDNSCLDTAEKTELASRNSWRIIYNQVLTTRSINEYFKKLLVEYTSSSEEALKRLEPMKTDSRIGKYISNYIENISWRQSLTKDLGRKGLRYVIDRMEKEHEISIHQNA